VATKDKDINYYDI